MVDMDFKRLRPVAVLLPQVVLSVFAVTGSAHSVTPPSNPKRSGNWTVRTSPSRLVNGAPIFLEVTTPERVTSLTGAWLGHEVIFDNRAGRVWTALAGVSLETKAGTYPFVLEGKTAAGTQITFRRNFTVGHARYPVIQLQVSKQFTEPNPEQVQVIKEDQELKHRTFSQVT